MPLYFNTIQYTSKIYKKIAIKLTKWENHRTRTQFKDNLISKTFAFQFVNNYASLFYLAFFRNVILKIQVLEV